MKQVRYKKASQTSICGPWEGIFWPMGLFQFLCQKKREAKKTMINPSWEPHQVTKQKKLTTNKDPYSTNFVNKNKIIKEEKTKIIFYRLVKS
jgi:hypothetical protein